MQVSKAFIPLGFPAQEVVPTKKNIQRWAAKSAERVGQNVLEGKAGDLLSHLFKSNSPVALGSGALNIAGVVTAIVGWFKGNSNAKVTGLLMLGLGIIGGIVNGCKNGMLGILKHVLDPQSINDLSRESYDTEDDISQDQDSATQQSTNEATDPKPDTSTDTN